MGIGDESVWAVVTAREYRDGTIFYDVNYAGTEQKARGFLVLKDLADEPSKSGGETTLTQSITPEPGNATSPENTNRGQIRLGANRQFSIDLLEKADLSTFLHETGHFYLEPFGDVVDELRTRPGELTAEQQKIVADYDKALEWLGVESRDKIGNEVRLEVVPRRAPAWIETGSIGHDLSVGQGRAPRARVD